MTLEQITEWFAWMTAVNIGLYALAALFVLFARGWLADLHTGMFGIERPDLHRAYFAYLAYYKVAIIVFCLVPYIALRVMN